jgi:hypothetical protein
MYPSISLHVVVTCGNIRASVKITIPVGPVQVFFLQALVAK